MFQVLETSWKVANIASDIKKFLNFFEIIFVYYMKSKFCFVTMFSKVGKHGSIDRHSQCVDFKAGPTKTSLRFFSIVSDQDMQN